MNEIIGLVTMLGGALGLAIGGVAVFAFFLEAEGRWRQHAAPVVLATILFAMTAGTLISGRNVSHAGEDFSDVVVAGSGAATWLLRLCTLTVVGICAARIGAYFLRREKNAAPGFWLLASFLFYFVSNSVTNAILGTHPAFVHGIYYALLVFCAVYIGRGFPFQPALHVVRNGLLAFIALSFMIALLKPELAIQRNYTGFIPGLNIRFWGLGSNPNSIGPLAAVLILITSLSPFRKPLITWGTMALASLTLVLSQSKTAWLALALALGVVVVYRVLAQARSPRQKFDQAMYIGIAFCLIGILSLMAYLLIDVGHWIDRAIATKAGTQITTLTGRSAIWQVAISAWLDNPLFGYGITMWDPIHRYQIGMPFAFSAHNQWLQSLGGAGAFGLAGLVIYMLVALKFAWRARAATRGISLALLVFLIFRCITETPLETDTLFNGDILVHLTTFMLLLAFGGDTERNIEGEAK